MADQYVLDASVVLAALNNELGGDVVMDRLKRSIISSVNLAEGVTKLTLKGVPRVAIDMSIEPFIALVAPFELKDAFDTGHLVVTTRRYGLSLGDCACLALAAKTNRVALTSDRVWAELGLSQRIETVR
jgi:ribonuclease VapC